MQSIDALRGFDMFWIIRGDALAKAIATWLGFPALASQFEHVKWNGFHFYDLIFPLFLFVVGVVLPFSLSKYTDSSGEKVDFRSAHLRIVKRTLLLIFFGMVYSGFLQFNLAELRWPGVLQRTGICYFFAALAVLHLRSTRQILLVAGLLVGYWCLLLFVPAPGFQPYDLTKEGCLVGYVDRQLIPGKLYYRYGDNEGILSTFPALATTLLGALAGQWLRSSRSPAFKVWGLYLISLACLAGGYLWSYWFPLNKILWTSSFVLVTGGYSFALLATFYWLIDVLGFRRWSFFFVVIGMNAITIYMMQQFVDFSKISQFFLGGIISMVGTACANKYTESEVEAAQKAILMVGVLTCKWLMLWYLYRKQTFLKL
jgi:predicted acyltransferase